MSVKEIILAGNPILRKKSKEIKEPSREEKLINDLKDTLIEFRRKNKLGRGIAAPQIGISKRVLYIITDKFSGELINPKITKHSKKTSLWWDSCFSYKAAVFAKVKRWEKIKVEYFDLNGNNKILEAKGSLSELLQHEIDHLNGILFMDRVTKLGEYLIMREEWERMGRPSRANK